MAGCSCGGQCRTLIYSCSGSANTGYLADAVARKLAKEQRGKMTCLTAVGAGLSGYLESAKSADKNIAIDGCAVACGTKIFEKNGLPCVEMVLTDFGVEKGKTEITAEVVDRVASEIQKGI